MTSTFTPAREVAKTLVAALRADSAIASLLFPAWSARVNSDDDRVYTVNAQLPDDPAVRAALPRVLIETRWTGADVEQWDGTLHGPVSVYLHVLVPKDREEFGDQLTTAVVVKVLSTPLSGARIIAAELSLDSMSDKSRVPAFDDAWEYIVVFRSPNVGVLV